MNAPKELTEILDSVGISPKDFAARSKISWGTLRHYLTSRNPKTRHDRSAIILALPPLMRQRYMQALWRDGSPEHLDEFEKREIPTMEDSKKDLESLRSRLENEDVRRHLRTFVDLLDGTNAH